MEVEVGSTTSDPTQRCVVLDAKETENKHMPSLHVSLIKDMGSQQSYSQRNRIASKFNFLCLNEWSSEDAYLAPGSNLEDKPCDICGDAGFAESISTCFNCQISREHIYCMKVLLQEVPEMWFCESCRSSADTSSRKLAVKELLLPVALASNASRAAKTGTSSKLCKDPRQLSAHLFPVVKSGAWQHGCPSKDPGDQMGVETTKVKFKPREKLDKLSFGSQQLERSLQSNSGLIPSQSTSMKSITKKTVIIKTGPTKFSLMKVQQTPRFLSSGYENAEASSLTSTEFKGGTSI